MNKKLFELIKTLLKSHPNLNKEGSKQKYFHQFDQSLETPNYLVDAIYLGNDDKLMLSTTYIVCKVTKEQYLEDFIRTGNMRPGLLSRGPERMTEMEKWKFLQTLISALDTAHILEYYIVYTQFTSKPNYYYVAYQIKGQDPVQISPKYVHHKSAVNFAIRYQLPIPRYLRTLYTVIEPCIYSY